MAKNAQYTNGTILPNVCVYVAATFTPKYWRDSTNSLQFLICICVIGTNRPLCGGVCEGGIGKAVPEFTNTFTKVGNVRGQRLSDRKFLLTKHFTLDSKLKISPLSLRQGK